MATTYTLPKDLPTPYVSINELIRRSRNWKSRGAAFGLCGGVAAPVLGSVLTVVSWLVDPAWHGFSLHHAATSLFVVAIPLLILGAHCLDLLDKSRVAADRPRAKGLRDGDCH